MAWKWQARTLDPDQWAEAGNLLNMLAARYPVLGARPAKPMAIGTGDRLKAAGAEIGLTEEQADLVMVRITRASSYLAALARGGPRYDLDGSVAGEVSSSERKLATAILAGRRVRRAKRALNDAAMAHRAGVSDQQSAGDDGSVGGVKTTAVPAPGESDVSSKVGEANEVGKTGGADDRAAA